MSVTLEELDGKYLVHTETSQADSSVVNGDGETEIRNGLTYRKDKNGFIWESAFSIIGPGQVQMESTIDPSHAGTDKFIRDEKGNLTKSMMTYKTVLETGNDQGRLTLKGTIVHAGETTRLTMTKMTQS